MRYRIKPCTDLDLIHELTDMTTEVWDEREGSVHWVAWDETDEPAGFCSANMIAEGMCYFTNAGVLEEHRGSGLQKRLIKVRLQWAKKNGAVDVVTYTMLHNYPSIINLLKCGFRFYRPEREWVGPEVHYFIRSFE